MKTNQIIDTFDKKLSIYLTAVLIIAASSCIVTDSGSPEKTGSAVSEDSLSIYEGLTGEGVRGGGAGNKPDTGTDTPYDLFLSKAIPYNIQSLHTEAIKEISEVRNFEPKRNYFGSSPELIFRNTASYFLKQAQFPVSISNSRIIKNNSNEFKIEIEIMGAEGSCVGTGSAGVNSATMELQCVFYYSDYIMNLKGVSR